VAVSVVATTPGALVVVKPAGLASELARDPAADSLVRRLQADGHRDLRLVHRLDAPACGLMLVARTQAAAAHYSREIEARRWHKWYVARLAQPVDVTRGLVGWLRGFGEVMGCLAKCLGGCCTGWLPVVFHMWCARPSHGRNLLNKHHNISGHS